MTAPQFDRIALNVPTLAEEQLEALRDLLPAAFVDGILDPTALLATLGHRADASSDVYELTWAGKTEAGRALRRTTVATLHPDLHNSVGSFDACQHVFIEGDNLEVLRLLQRSYNDQVKLIYIDPPYNTTNDFVYNDDFTDSLGVYLAYSGQADSDGNMVSATVESGGRRHSGWLSFMYPRLSLARNLLRNDGAILVSIDDNEVHNLRLLMDDVFGQENFVGQFIWAAGWKNDSKFVSESHEYIVAYARNKAVLKSEVGEWRTRKPGLEAIYAEFARLKKKHADDHAAISAGLRTWYRALPDGDPSKRQKHYCHVDHRGIYFPDNISWPGGGGPKYQVLHPKTGKPVKVPAGGWRFPDASRMQEVIDDQRIHFGEDESTVPCIKSYLQDREEEVPYSVFYQDGRGATKRLRALMGGDYFTNPKDEFVLQRIIEFSTGPNDLIVDLFAGSGTTGHAVMLQNHADGGSRRFVMVNLPEPTPEDSDARVAGYETVSAIGRARIVRVAQKLGLEDFSMRCLSLGESNFKVWDPSQVSADSDSLGEQLALFADSLRPTATDDGIAAEVLLKEGVRLDVPWERLRIANQDVIVAGTIAVCLARTSSPELVARLLELDVEKLVVLDGAFVGRDTDKANLLISAGHAGIQVRAV